MAVGGGGSVWGLRGFSLRLPISHASDVSGLSALTARCRVQLAMIMLSFLFLDASVCLDCNEYGGAWAQVAMLNTFSSVVENDTL